MRIEPAILLAGAIACGAIRSKLVTLSIQRYGKLLS